MAHTRALTTSALILMLSVQSVSTQAQDDPPPAADEQQSTSEAQAPEPASDNESGGEARDDSPFDYRSSEKISEDLSVSFPIDI